MALNLEEWRKVLNSLRFDSKDHIIKQIADKLKDTEKLKYKGPSFSYRDWKNRAFDISHPFNVEYRRYESREEQDNNKFDMRCPFYTHCYVINERVMDAINLPLLYIAAFNGQLEVVDYLLSEGADVDAQVDRSHTLLHLAAHNDQLEMVDYLLSKGVDVNVKGHLGCTPLHLAAEKCHRFMIHYLVSEGADVDVMDDYGYTPALLAAKNGNKTILSSKSNFNVQDSSGFTPLHHFAKSGNLEMVRYLVSKGADVNIMDRKGYTPALLAAKNGHEGIVTILSSENNFNVQDSSGFTPLHHFAKSGNLEMVRYLVSKGANVNVETPTRITPLHLANNVEVVNALIKAGADINATIIPGYTPLYRATGISFEEVIDAVRERRITNTDGIALYLASDYHEIIAKCLIAHEVKLKGPEVQKPEYLVQHNSDSRREMSEYWDKCIDEIKKLKKEDEPLYDFLRESNINNLVSIWERYENVPSKFDNQESLKKQYQEYAHILIDKVNEVKKEIFLHNHEPLIDALSTHYERDFKKMTFNEVETLFQNYRNDEIFEDITMPLGDFVDCKNSIKRSFPTLKAKALGEFIRNLSSKNLDNTSGNSSASLQSTKRSKLHVIAASMLKMKEVAIGGIAVGVYCLFTAAIKHYCNMPSDSLENSSAEAVGSAERER